MAYITITPPSITLVDRGSYSDLGVRVQVRVRVRVKVKVKFTGTARDAAGAGVGTVSGARVRELLPEVRQGLICSYLWPLN